VTAKKGYPKISVDGFKIGTNGQGLDSVLQSSAQSTSSCAALTSLEALANSVYALLVHNSEIAELDKAVIEIQLLSGCRIGSVLMITGSDVSSIGQVRIPPEKGGKSVIVTPVLTRSFWQRFRSVPMSIGQERNRFYYYRLYRKYGVYALVEGNTNFSVTHSLRHASIASTESLNLTSRERANYAGQSSVTSQNSYLPGQRKQRKATSRD
jgi:integrase